MRFIHLLFVLAIASGCAVKPFRSERAGLFDRLNHGSSGRKLEPVKIGKMPYRKPTDELRKLAFQWPLSRVEVTSRYGARGDGFHEGIDLKAPVGTPVFVAQDGLVLHSGSQISGYGKMVVVRHAGGWATVYAHNSKLLVRQGQRVRKGQKIAISGQSGRVSGPHLHFEVRNGLTAYDPLDILGKPGARVTQASDEGDGRKRSANPGRKIAKNASQKPARLVSPASRRRPD